MNDNKTLLAEVFANNGECPQNIVKIGNSALMFDGQAVVVALGKPTGATNKLERDFQISKHHLINRFG